MIKLRDYQQEARVLVNKNLNKGKNTIFVSPTGTGKTKTAVSIIKDRVLLGNTIFILVPQEEIFKQWVKDLIENKLRPGMIRDGKIMGKNRKVYVVMPGTLIGLLPYLPEKNYPTEIITDEAHHSEASTWQKIYDFFPKAKRLGLTATPERTDGKPLFPTYEEIVSTITMKQAIEKKFLAKPFCIVPEQYAIKVPIINGDYDPKRQSSELGKPKIIGNVIDTYEKVFCGLPIIVACCTYSHAADMTEQFKGRGWKFEHLHSKLSKEDRDSIVRKLRDKKLNGVCTVGIGIEGMDIPGLYGLIWLRRTMSLTIYLQFCGRVLRPLEGKDRGIIVDPVGNLFIHGFPEADRDWDIKKEGFSSNEDKEKKIVICENCGLANPLGELECEYCGWPLPKKRHTGLAGKVRNLPEVIDGNLVPFNSLNEENIEQRIKEEKEKTVAENKKAEEQKKAQEAKELSSQEKLELFRKNALQPKNRVLFRRSIDELFGGRE